MNRTLNQKMQEKRVKILECALDLFATRGYANTPVREVIDESGFGTGTFYKYFSNKEDVLKTLLDDFLDKIINSINDYYKMESDLYLRFIETKRVVMEVFAGNEKLADIYSRVAGISDGINQSLKEFDDRFLQFARKNIRYGIKKGVFRDVPVEPISNATLAIIKYAVYKWVVQKDITQKEMIDMVISFHQTLAVGLLEKNPSRIL